MTISGVYPRTISIHRPDGQCRVGEVGYGGLVEAKEELIADGISASIQFSSLSKGGGLGLPGDSKASMWKIFFSGSADLVKVRDIIVDDLGIRYQVHAPYWNVLGYNLMAERLET